MRSTSASESSLRRSPESTGSAASASGGAGATLSEAASNDESLGAGVTGGRRGPADRSDQLLDLAQQLLGDERLAQDAVGERRGRRALIERLEGADQ